MLLLALLFLSQYLLPVAIRWLVSVGLKCFAFNCAVLGCMKQPAGDAFTTRTCAGIASDHELRAISDIILDSSDPPAAATFAACRFTTAMRFTCT